MLLGRFGLRPSLDSARGGMRRCRNVQGWCTDRLRPSAPSGISTLRRKSSAPARKASTCWPRRACKIAATIRLEQKCTPVSSCLLERTKSAMPETAFPVISAPRWANDTLQQSRPVCLNRIRRQARRLAAGAALMKVMSQCASLQGISAERGTAESHVFAAVTPSGERPGGQRRSVGSTLVPSRPGIDPSGTRAADLKPWSLQGV